MAIDAARKGVSSPRSKATRWPAGSTIAVAGGNPSSIPESRTAASSSKAVRRVIDAVR
jgi:hypothetical protein